MNKETADPLVLLQKLLALRGEILQEGTAIFARWQPLIQRSFFRISARNLAFYLSLRCRDMRNLQKELTYWGLSSLGRSEARIVSNLDAVIAALSCICGKQDECSVHFPSPRSFFLGDQLLRRNSRAVLGPEPPGRKVRILVTFPTEAADDYALVRDFIRQGMNIARINCAHDGPQLWAAMIDHVRRAERELNKSCRILMDIAGPKPRINSLLVTNPDARLHTGDRFILTRNGFSSYDGQPASIMAECSIPEVFDYLEEGDPVLVDDGRIEAVVETLSADRAVVKIIQTRPQGEKLRAQKSLNFPGSPILLSPLTEKDLQDLNFIAEHADLIGYSFIKESKDIILLQQELKKRIGGRMKDIPLIAKIETSQAIENLPDIIVQAAAVQPFGVMIARGDLAVEVGYKRLAELQEEIMWICEAAHIPVIWATQVLENMVKKGIPSRSEITDAAMSERAECVMLNKGPFLAETIGFLEDVLESMQAHQYKKSSQLRALKIAINSTAEAAATSST